MPKLSPQIPYYAHFRETLRVNLGGSFLPGKKLGVSVVPFNFTIIIIIIK